MTTERRGRLSHPILWTAVLLLVVADLALKSWSFSAVGLGNTHRLAGDWLAVHCITNPGGVWGLGKDWTPVLTLIRLVAVGVMVWLIGRQDPANRRGLTVLAMLIGGAVGNLYDNLSAWMPWPGNGEVRDFVWVYFAEPGWWPGFLGWPFAPWPIFNLADSLIVLAFLALITGFAHLRVKEPEPDDGGDSTPQPPLDEADGEAAPRPLE